MFSRRLKEEEWSINRKAVRELTLHNKQSITVQANMVANCQLMPRFNLPDERGHLISLSSVLQTGPAVISINRGHWCPYCKLELRSLAAINSEIERLGARVVSIIPDSARFTEAYVANNNLPFPVLSDIDLGYSLSLGLIFWVGAEIQKLYREVGVELEKYHGNQAYFLPM